jgi:amino acid adenylation domain-containing protein
MSYGTGSEFESGAIHISEEAPFPGAASLVELLEARAASQPLRRIYTFLKEGDEEEGQSLTFRELEARARGLAAVLEGVMTPGERALLLYPPGLEFVSAFVGCLCAGVVAVPAYPPASSHGLPRLLSIARDSRPGVILSDSRTCSRLETLVAKAPELEGLRWLATDEIPDSRAGDWRPPEIHPDSLAFLQYTSGSTANPKGVRVTHGNLLHNQELIRSAFRQSEESVVVGWLPLYHDMGLIGNVLQPLYTGSTCYLMSPLDFLQRPVRWLQAISRYRGTTSGGPNFAYDLCVRKTTARERSELDLRSWSLAFNGAEPVRAATLERFAEAFADSGFRADAFFPCYGLAEATLLVSGDGEAPVPVVTWFAARPLEESRIEERAADAGGSRPLVASGRVAGDQRVLIVEPETCRPRPPDRVGEIWIQGRSVAAGYWENPDETARTFGARLSTGEGPFLRTGDLGFLHGGRLFIAGRLKDLIIVRGRNHYPQDIERTVEESHPCFRPGCGAAFSVEVEGEERLVVVQEVERTAARDLEAEQAVAALRRGVAEIHEIEVWTAVLVRAGGVPKTSSGKVRRGACRQAFLTGALPLLHESGPARLESAAADLLPVAVELDRTALLAMDAAQRRPVLEASLQRAAARGMGVPVSAVAPEAPLALDSLALMELQSRLESAFGLRVALAELFERPSLADLSSRILAGLEGPGETPVACVPVRRGGAPPRELPLSWGQRALWFLAGLEQASHAYHVPVAARVRSGLDLPALRRALEGLQLRHAVLRSAFGERRGEPVQRILERPDLPLAEMDARGWSDSELARALRDEVELPFDFALGPPWRARLYDRGTGDRVLLLVFHHILVDLWSLVVLAEELGALSAAEPLPVPGASYGDFVAWQEEMLAGPRGDQLRRYWEDRLGGELPVLQLPADRPRPAFQSFRGAAVRVRFDEELSGRVRSLAGACEATFFTVLLAAFQVLLQRITGRDEILVGSPATGRTRPEWARVVGYLVNPVVLRGDLTGDPGFADFASALQRVVIGALEHQDYPFPLLVERLQPGRDPSHSPLFQVLFALEKPPSFAAEGLSGFILGDEGGRLRLGDLDLESVPVERRASQFDLSLLVAEGEGSLRATLEISTDLLDETTAHRIARHFERLLASFAADPRQRLSEASLLSSAEQAQILSEWGTAAPVPEPPATLHELVRAQAEATPDAVALIGGDRQLTYGELAREVAPLADRLRRLGVRPEVRVGVLLGRSPDLIVAILAVLEAGGAYVPLDPAYPEERLAFMLEDAGAAALVTETGLAKRLLATAPPVCAVVCLDGPDTGVSGSAPRRPERAAGPGNLAYVIYTSGSTGRPKGVAIEHRSAAALLAWARQVFSRDELAGVLASTSICFDLSVFEIFLPLSAGGSLLLAADALELPSLAARDRVTLVNTVPSALAELLRLGGLPPGARTINLAGEPLQEVLARRIYATGTVERLFNLYGPTEDTTYSTFSLVPREGAPSIGYPIAGTRAVVLDRWGHPAPVGVPGDLYLGGAGLARGYLGRPALTAERFVPDPLAEEPGARLYRTGDLVRWRPTGELEFLGRRDHQVKIRGFRIELGEIEEALGALPGVREAAVLARGEAKGEDRRLVAYVVLEGSDTASLRQALRSSLPSHMVPGAYVVLPALPLTTNGKVDRRALERIEPVGEERRREEGGPARTPLEEVVAGLWADVLGLAEVGVEERFFDLGGHSLLAVRIVSRLREVLGVELPLRAVFEDPTVAALTARIEAARGATAMPPIEPAHRDGDLPLSFAQQRLWFLHQLDPESAAYHIAGAVVLTGDLEPGVLEASLREILRRHEALRTSFPSVAGEPVQVIAPERLCLPRVDLAGLPESRRGSEARSLAEHEARRPFDLARGPLVRLLLLRLGARDHRLVVVLHHIISDGASLEVFLRELGVLYAAFAAGLPSPLPELPVQYTDFAVWQRRALTPETLAEQLGWWAQRLSGVPVVELASDRPRGTVVSDLGGGLPLDLTGLEAPLRSLGRTEGATLYVTLLAGLSALLGRLTGLADIPVGSPVATRGRVETEGLIGLLINTLVLRIALDGDPDGRELLRRARSTVLDAHAHGDVPFEQVVDALHPERSLQRSPLFQIMLAHLRAASGRTEVPGLELRFEEVDTATSKFDLSLWVRETDEGLDARLVYKRELFEPATMARLAGHVQTLLAGLAEEPGRRVSDLPLLTLAERRQLLAEWNATAVPFPRDRCLHELFAEQAERTPEAPALLSAAGSLTFREVDRRANRTARRLRELGVGPDVLVGVCADRSPEMVVALLGIWKAGGAYLPLDPAYPRERLSWILEDSGAPVVATRGGLLAGLVRPGTTEISLDDLARPGSAGDDASPGVSVDPDNLAYVVYTSGTTGRPKGTMIRHRSAVNLAAALRCAIYASCAGPLRVGVNASLAFDASVKQLVQILSGHALAVLPEEVRRDGVRLLSFLREHRLDVLDCTPSQLRLLLDEAGREADGLPSLVLVGGEAIEEGLWRELAARGGFWNVYGPTECTVDATVWPVGGERPVLGRPIANVRVHLLDGALQPVPLGTRGEICIAGVGLARGYWQRPDLTALRFVPDPLAEQPGARLYRTGDLGRRLADGTLEFLGRTDHQVKVRGFRVELGEIESQLGEHPAIAQAAVLCREDARGEPRLIAFYTAAGDGVSEGELRDFLRRSLPEPMLPALFIRLERLPLTPNGKVDRRALPDPGDLGGRAGREPVAPRTPLEETLAGIWSGLLRVEPVGVRDSFFELGGHSLLAAQLVSRVRQTWGVELPLRDLFEAPTIEAMAAAIESRQTRQGAGLIQARPRGKRNLSQLMGELRSLSPEQARQRLRESAPSPRRSS